MGTMSSPAFLGLRTAQFHVADLRAARDWYTRALGIEPYFDQPFYVGFDVGGFELGLVPDGPARGTAGTLSVYWGVADIDAAHASLVELGAAAAGPIEDVGAGIRKATVVDPFGNALGIIENPHFRYGSAANAGAV